MNPDPIDDRNADEPPKAFFILRIGHIDRGSQCYTDDPKEVATYMWGRGISQYALWINNRSYDWPKTPLLDVIEEHLKHALDMDNALYPPEEFPRGHWWE